MKIDNREIRKILIMKRGALGDIIAGTPALKRLREVFPMAHITLVSNAIAREVVPEGTLIDRLLVFKDWAPSKFHYFKLIRHLRSEKYDLAINFRYTSEGDTFIAWASGAPIVLGFGPPEVKFLLTHKAHEFPERRHEYVRHMDMLEAIGIFSPQVEPWIHISKEELLWAQNFFSQKGLNPTETFVLGPGASVATKAWLEDRFIEVGRRFLASYPKARILVCYGPIEIEATRAQRVAAALGDRALLSPPTTLGQVAGLLKNSTLCLCNNSGLMNIASAVNLPVIVTSVTAPHDWAAWGPEAVTLYPYPYDSFAGLKEFDYKTPESAKTPLLESISVDWVFETVCRKWDQLHFGIKSSQ